MEPMTALVILLEVSLFLMGVVVGIKLERL